MNLIGTELLNSKKILKSIPEDFEAFDGKTGKPPQLGDEFTVLRLEVEKDTRIPCTNPEHAGNGSKFCADCAKKKGKKKK